MDVGVLENEIYKLSETLGSELIKRKLLVATAESCTGGLISASFTEVPGSSAWFERGFVTYTNQAKHEMLNVSNKTLETYGAVSEETVREMSLGALNYSHADFSVAVSGIAGPTGGTIEKPVGTVWMAWAYHGEVFHTYKSAFLGNRQEIRLETVKKAIEIFIKFIDKNLR